MKAVEALRAIKTQAGLDGALFGRMSTGVAISRVDSAVSVAHAMGVGAVQSVAEPGPRRTSCATRRARDTSRRAS